MYLLTYDRYTSIYIIYIFTFITVHPTPKIFLNLATNRIAILLQVFYSLPRDCS